MIKLPTLVLRRFLDIAGPCDTGELFFRAFRMRYSHVLFISTANVYKYRSEEKMLPQSWEVAVLNPTKHMDHPKTLSFALALVAFLFATIVDASTPAPVCYYRTQKCCFNYTACGYATKKLEKKVDCSYKKCEEKCEDVCYPDQTCSAQRVEDGEDCKTIPGESYGYSMDCKTKYTMKEVSY